MSDDELAKIAGEVVGRITEKAPVYEDAIQPVAKEVGKALGTIGGLINVALAPVSLMVHGYSVIEAQLKQRLEEKFAKTSSEKIISPPLPIIGPLLDRYRYVHDDPALSDMFVNLLANAMDIDHVRKAHPAFVRIISELSPDEAKLLRAIAAQRQLPKLDLYAELPNDKGEVEVFLNFTKLGEIAGIQSSGNLIYSYLDNLIRLGILETRYGSLGTFYTDEKIYEALLNDPEVDKLRQQLQAKDLKLGIHKGLLRVTPLGRLFMNAVLQQAVTCACA